MALSLEHATLVLLFENQPRLALDLLQQAGRLPSDGPWLAEIASADLTQAVPAEYRADLVLRCQRGESHLVVVVEIQRDPDPDKRFSWPVYVTLLRARFRGDVQLFVFAPDPAVARWARQPIDLGNSAVFVPTVFSLEDVPAVTDVAAARADPELAVLSALAHGGSGDTERAVAVGQAAFSAAADLPSERGVLYYDLVRAALSEAARKVIDAMIPEGYEFKSDFARKYFAEGRAEGRAEGLAQGEANAVLAVLEARGIALSPEQRERIVACNDVAILHQWVRRAVSASDASELFV